MFVIGITGGSGSGKSTLSKILINEFKDIKICYIQQDSYYKDRRNQSLKERSTINYDEPDAFDNDLILLQLNELKNGKFIAKPVYDFKTHSRLEVTDVVYPKRILILEGITIFFNKDVRDLFDIKIFLDINSDTRLLRRITRDTKDRGRSKKSIIDQWNVTVEPMYKKYIHPTKKYADIIYKKDPTKEEIDNLVTKIRNLNVS